MRIAHISDVHLGYRAYSRLTSRGINQREQDVLQAFRHALQLALEQQPDLILITGDLFHSVRPPNFSLVNAYRWLSKVQQERNGAPLIIIAGNHETPRSTESICILRLLGHIPGVQVADGGIESLRLDTLGVHALCIPARGLYTLPTTRIEPDPKAKVNLLLLHGILEGLTPYAVERPVSRQLILNDDWDYIALGDWHLYTQVAPNAIYAGATEFTSTNIWEEAGKPKGFVLYDTDTRQHQFLKVPTRAVYDLLPIDARELTAPEINEQIRARAESLDITNAVVRQRIYHLMPEQRSGLDGNLLRELRARALHYYLDLRMYREARTMPKQNALSDPNAGNPAGADEEGEPRLTLIEEWCEFARRYELPPDVERDELINLGVQYLSKIE
ncbi:Nuclease SbcCD subunit D [bacterium HR15]|nr:Nuclease SbcCD subunit D [bacterium HR15]